MTTPKNARYEWTGGVWYDPSLLPAFTDTCDAKALELRGKLCDMNWDVIFKTYDPIADRFVYKRVANASLRAEHMRKQMSWLFSPNGDAGRPVAIMPHPKWEEVYATRLQPLPTVDPLYKAIDEALGNA